MMSSVRRVAARPSLANGAVALLVRAMLVIAGLGILALGVHRLPEIAMTQGEVAIGLTLSVLVSLQMFVAALFFPMGIGDPR